MKAYLSGRGIEFQERDVSSDQRAVFELVRTYNSRTTPTVVIDEQVVIGFDPGRIDELLSR